MSTHFQVGIFFFLFFPPSTQAAGIANPEPSLSGQTWLMPFVSLSFMHAEQQGALQGTACSVRLVWPSPVSSASFLPATLVQRDPRIRLGHGTRWIPRSNGSEDSSNHPLQSDPTSLGQRGILCSIPAHQPFPALGLGTTAWSAINDDPLLFTGCISQLLLPNKQPQISAAYNNKDLFTSASVVGWGSVDFGLAGLGWDRHRWATLG